MRIRELLEARRNPHLNPRIDPIDTFSMYANKPNMFVTFTQLPKVGINPQSNYNTPIGVYSYPLKYVLERAYQKGSLFGAAPFASDAKYVHLFQQTSRNIFDVSTYGKSQYEMDVRKLYNYFDNIIGVDVRGVANDTASLHKEIASEMGGFSYGRRMWNLIYKLIDYFTNGSKVTVEATRILFRVLGYDAVYDLDGKGVIHSNEPTQAVHFNTQTIRVVESFSNKEMGQDRIQARREMLNLGQLKREFDNVFNWYIQEEDILDTGYEIRAGSDDVDRFMRSYQRHIQFLDRVHQVIEKRQNDLEYITKDDLYDLVKNINGVITNGIIEMGKLIKGNLALRWLSSIGDVLGEWVYRNGTTADVVDSMGISVAGLKRPESMMRVRNSIIEFVNGRR